MEAAAALSAPRVALDARARVLFSPPSTLPTPPSPNLRVAASPRALAAACKPRFLNPHPDPAGGVNSGGGRDVVAMVVPFLRGTAWEQPPPDLASFLYKNRIVYLGMCLVPSVTELMLAEFLYLQYEDAEKPIYLYINSTGTTKNGEKLGYETEALAIYDAMRYVKVPIFTLCVGNAWGEAALLLAAGAKGNRAALPSSTIMIKQVISFPFVDIPNFCVVIMHMVHTNKIITEEFLQTYTLTPEPCCTCAHTLFMHTPNRVQYKSMMSYYFDMYCAANWSFSRSSDRR
uniref:ATP-dependent Clp protease proteolytic subunit n=1 Tax=Arundo donax TaxID=35708 RepID=A0A0A9D5D9_ARUDO